MLNLKALSSESDSVQESVKIESIPKKDVAIIGVSCSFASARDQREYWDLLINGRDCIREFPAGRRKDNEAYLEHHRSSLPEQRYYQGGFLEEIAQFDPGFFKIAPAEAGLMNPNQRLFLESAWRAIEDAGYGSGKLTGSKTGVYLGNSTDFGVSYKEFIETLEPELAGVAIPGNINSVIAGRISYLLDFKGPSVVVDTACSSSLVAVHYACRDLLNGDCDIALAGSVKIDLLPLESIKKREDELGITSPNGKARTFDEFTEGTGLGEGVGVVVLKPLSQAIADGDHIYAIIKGSAVNQDGASVGLTAPNSAAQAELIMKAWQDAGCHPETISLLEAHGTGTKLGDPVEISGIQKAFNHYTSKKQICAIGSVKTNIGHLDHAAGMAGLIKIALALKFKALPPTLHFARPNRNIQFIESPVYINDRARSWETGGNPRRAGVSAFGLSGVNCHLVLEEAPEFDPNRSNSSGQSPATGDSMHILTLSAESENSLLRLVHAYQNWLTQEKKLQPENICYTAGAGRSHYLCRLALVFQDPAGLEEQLKQFTGHPFTTIPESNIYYGKSPNSKGDKNARAAAVSHQQYLTQVAGARVQDYLAGNAPPSEELLRDLGRLYVDGAEINWDQFYSSRKHYKVSLPGYPFARNRCWLGNFMPEPVSKPEIDHPLLDQCLAETSDGFIYLSEFGAETHWVLKEHLVNGLSVIPGTAYLEMIMAIMNRHYPGAAVQFKDVVFISPLKAGPGETVQVQTTVHPEADCLKFTIAGRSKDSQTWDMHVEGAACLQDKSSVPQYDLDRIKERCVGGEPLQYGQQADDPVQTGPRWNCVQTIAAGADEYLTYLELAPQFAADLNQFYLHPALMDEAVNILMKNSGTGLYLPFNYRSLKIYHPIPARFYSYIVRKKRENTEIATFNVVLLDESGHLILAAEDYSIKKVTESSPWFDFETHPYYQIEWRRNLKRPQIASAYPPTDHHHVLVWKSQDEISERLIQRLQREQQELIVVESGAGYQKLSGGHFTVSDDEANLKLLFQELAPRKIKQIILMFPIGVEAIPDLQSLEDQLRRSLYRLFYLTRALLACKIKGNIDLVLAAGNVYEVDGKEPALTPHYAALFGLGKVIGQEYPHLQCRCLDLGPNPDLETLVFELQSPPEAYQVAYRGGERYLPELTEVNAGWSSQPEGAPLEIKSQGVYVVTGGTGGLGLEICKYLAAKGQVNLALISRSSIPAREQWVQLIEAGAPSKLIRALTTIQAIEAGGSQVTCLSADVSNLDQMKQTLGQLRAKYGRINGIFHCAGVAGDGFVFRKSEFEFTQVIAPKIQGTFILDLLTASDEPDFLVLFSSITALLAGAGQSDYTAANSFLDTYAPFRIKSGRKPGKKKTLSINWPAWSEVGMAVDYGVDLEGELFRAVSPAEAIAALDLWMNKPVSNIVIGRLNRAVTAAQRDSLFFELSKNIQQELQAKPKPLKRDSAPKNHHRIQVTGAGTEGGTLGLEQKLARIWGRVLGLPEIDPGQSFNDLGGNSILATHLLKEMEKEFPGVVDITDLFTYSTIKDMAEYIGRKIKIEDSNEPFKNQSFWAQPAANAHSSQSRLEQDIAIIGMAGRFPGAKNLDEYWGNLKQGRNSIGEFPKNRTRDIIDFVSFAEKDFSLGGYFPEIDKFDASFFGIPPIEARYMNPLQRLLLEISWEAIEDAGYGGGQLIGSKTGVYIGTDHTSIGMDHDYTRFVEHDNPLIITGSWTSILSGRISYTFNLKGPSIVVDTACSSGIVSVHMAGDALRNKECDLAIAGGVCITVFPPRKDGILNVVQSKDGAVRAFDRRANGTIWSEGIGVVILKPLAQALRDQDHIYAVVKGSAVNNDGLSNGITAPDAQSQEEVILKAWEAAQIDPETITYVEAHGTGTALGDPIEIKGLTNSFRRFTDKSQFCGIGSVKSNIGHTVAASGMASMFKVILSMRHGVIPPSIHFEEPNPYIGFYNSPLYVNDRLSRWEKIDSPRRAGVSAFGFSGTNCHIVLEEAPELETMLTQREPQAPVMVAAQVKPARILTLSAKSEKALSDLVAKYLNFTSGFDDWDLDDLCYTANTGRGHYQFRLAILFQDLPELKESLAYLNSCSNYSRRERQNLFYGEHHLVSAMKDFKEPGEITELDQRRLSQAINSELSKRTSTSGAEYLNFLEKLAELYVQGAEIAWNEFYGDGNHRRLALPVYPFQSVRYWPQNNRANGLAGKELPYPLLDRYAAEFIDHDVYLTDFSVTRHWVLSDHLIMENYVLPGVTYLEMALEASRKYSPNQPVALQDVVFMTPLVVKKDERKTVQTVIKKESGFYEFMIGSKPESASDWVIHAKGKFRSGNLDPETVPHYQLGELTTRFNQNITEVTADQSEGVFRFGPHWRHPGEACSSGNEILLRLRLPEEFHGELSHYTLHPALLDNAVNFVSQKTGVGIYLPFFYKKLRVYRALPGEFYSSIRKKELTDSLETISFDITLIDMSGRVIVQIEDYTIKRMPPSEIERLSAESEQPAAPGDRADLNTSAFNEQKWYSSENAHITLKGRGSTAEYTSTEKMLGRIWGELLQLEEISIYDHFSNIGGNSIFAVKMEAEMEKNNLAVSMSDIYEHTTIKELAAYIDQQNTDREEPKKSGQDNLSLSSHPTPDNNPETGQAAGSHYQPGKNSITNIEPFNAVFYRQCFYNSLFPIVFHFGRNILPFLVNDFSLYDSDREQNWLDSDVRFLQIHPLHKLLNGMGISVSTKKHRTQNQPLTPVQTEDQKLIAAFASDLGLTIDQEAEIDHLTADIKNAILAQKPVIIWVDCFDESIRTDCYRKVHWPHTLLIRGFDDSQQCFDIIEHNHRENLTYQACKIQYQDLLNCHQGFLKHYCGVTTFPTYYEFQLVAGQARASDNRDFSKDVPEYLAPYRVNLLIQQPKVLDGLDCLKEVISQMKQAIRNETAFKENHEDLIYRMNKIINAKQIEHYKNIQLFRGAVPIATMSQTIVESWTSIRNALVKYSHLSKYNPERFQLINSQLDQVYLLECRYVDSLFELLGQAGPAPDFGAEKSITTG